MEYEQHQILCEDQEVKEEEQERQTNLAQFRKICELEANQEAAGRLLDDLSSDTKQDVLGSPNAIVPDSGASFSMRQSRDSTSNEQML